MLSQVVSLGATYSPEGKIQISIQIPQLNTEEVIGEDGRKYYKLSIPESHYYTQEEGAPQLPCIRKLIEIPASALNIKLKARYKEKAIEYNDVLVYPTPKKVIKQTPNGFRYIDEEFYINKEKYQKDLFLPEKVAEIKQDGFFRSVRILEIYVYPVRYNPKQRVLQFYSEIEINISYRFKQDTKTKKDKTKHFKGLLKNLLLNPEKD